MTGSRSCDHCIQEAESYKPGHELGRFWQTISALLLEEANNPHLTLMLLSGRRLVTRNNEVKLATFVK